MTYAASADATPPATSAHEPPQEQYKLAEGRSAEIVSWKDGQVLKRYRPGFPRAAVDTEFRLARTAHAAGVPTPAAEAVIETEGRLAIVFERCEGPTLYELVRSGAQKPERMAQIFFELQRAVHRSAPAGLPRFEQRIAASIEAAADVSMEAARAALDILERIPLGERFCHGDFHPANVIVTARGPVVVDWLNAARGAAVFDFARTLLILRYARPGGIDRQTRRAFLEAYLHACDAAGVDQSLVAIARVPSILARLAEPIDPAEREALHALLAAAPAHGC